VSTDALTKLEWYGKNMVQSKENVAVLLQFFKNKLVKNLSTFDTLSCFQDIPYQ
jgi:hypothetical protein